ncbi:MAG TPA: tripartite tricarboxylate transporter substrate binding protein [Burkholderiales bacterium]|nr:tripartite tricarboxylate transporter substrate binding protein [Burkholderiales bacterium]
MRFVAIALVPIALPVLLAGPAPAQPFPSRPIRLIAPAAPGAASDVRARWIAEKLAPALGQTVVVENRAGAGGTIATEAAAKATPDGYTILLVTQGTLALAPHMYTKPGYDALADFAPVTRLSLNPFLLAVNPQLPIETVADLVQYAKGRPGQLSYGSPGSGTPPHMASELFRIMAKIDAVHVPYKGGAAALLDLIGGRLAYTFENLALQMPQVRAGKIRAVAVTGAARLASLPNVPTVAESGLPGYEYMSWMGVGAPAKTPRAIVARLHAEIAKILQTSDAREWLAAQGAEPGGDSPEAFGVYIKAEYARWGPIIREAGIKSD